MLKILCKKFGSYKKSQYFCGVKRNEDSKIMLYLLIATALFYLLEIFIIANGKIYTNTISK
nr:MAG TPA: hypothetical protein [Caudoviricetes sp.]